MTDPAEVIEVTFGGQTFRAGRRTAAHLDYTQARLQEHEPDANLVVIQPPFNTGVDASAGTHDFDGVLDVAILGMDWFPAQRFLRENGWAAWFRVPPFSPHIHMISLGCPGRVGDLIPGQILDYYNHAFGLKNQHEPNSDTSWFPDDIDATIFDYPAWEAAMASPKDWTQDDWDAIEKRLPGMVWNFVVRKARAATKSQPTAVTEQTAQAALKKAANG